jgi:hypothetical protein
VVATTVINRARAAEATEARATIKHPYVVLQIDSHNLSEQESVNALPDLPNEISVYIELDPGTTSLSPLARAPSPAASVAAAQAD